MASLESLEAAVRPETLLIWVETPTNPLLKLVDLEAVATLARKRGILAACDNTFATPRVQRPLELGFDVAIHSATQYLNGHYAMVSAILVLGANDATAEQASVLQNTDDAIQVHLYTFPHIRCLQREA